MNDTNFKESDVTQKGELARQQLIDAALALFSENGLEGTSTRELARQAQQNIGAIAYYFQSKEGLYLAAAQHIKEFIHSAFGPLLDQIEELIALDSDETDPECYLDYVKKVISIFCSVLTHPETLVFSKFIVREQLSPTSAFRIIHEDGLSRIHTNLTRLVARYIGVEDNSPQAVLHSHPLIGELLAFRVGRETFLRRIGWNELDDAKMSIIAETLIEHIDLILRGLRTKYRRS